MHPVGYLTELLRELKSVNIQKQVQFYISYIFILFSITM